jgi:hypothetical protein
MSMRRRFSAAAILTAVALVCASCGGLDRTIRQQIAAEKQSLPQVERTLQQSQQAIRDDLAHSPDLFAAAKVKTEWPARLQSAQQTLSRAKDDLNQLDKLSRDARTPDDNRRAERLLADERSQRLKVLSEAESVQADANSWLDFERNLPHYVSAMQREYDTIHNFDLAPVAVAVQKAEQDWPAKKGDLDGRLTTLRQTATDADTQWRSTEAARQDATAGTAKGPEIATLIEANDQLRREADKLPHDAEQLRAATGQLYDSWDKVLADLEVSQHGTEKAYAEKVNTVRTHYTDVAAKKTEVSTNAQWVDVPASTYRSVENNLGMTIAHKDAGQFDSEAKNEVQPPGFAYIAPPEVGRNQYGYWSHDGGHSVWTWLPEYLIMRDLLWGHSYQPVYINEYHGYQTALRSGQVYYGRETPASPPKYGSHGTFTQQRYSSSRYVQSGGYAGSGYANRSAGTTASRPSPGFSPRSEPDENPGAGKRFGGSSSGQRFGSGNKSPSSGQRFGAPRSAPRSSGGMRFGGRRR